jgi:hypothetical protein
VGGLSNHVAELISILGFVHDDEKFLAACVRAITTSSSHSQLEPTDTYRGLLQPVTHSRSKIYIFEGRWNIFLSQKWILLWG